MSTILIAGSLAAGRYSSESTSIICDDSMEEMIIRYSASLMSSGILATRFSPTLTEMPSLPLIPQNGVFAKGERATYLPLRSLIVISAWGSASFRTSEGGIGGVSESGAENRPVFSSSLESRPGIWPSPGNPSVGPGTPGCVFFCFFAISVFSLSGCLSN